MTEAPDRVMQRSPWLSVWFSPGLLILGTLTGITGLYLFGLLLRSAGKPLGGHASAMEICAALAWSAVPTVAGAAIYFVALLSLHRSLIEASSKQVLAILTGALWIATALSLWSLVAILFMLR
jgi:hypothetical protein